MKLSWPFCLTQILLVLATAAFLWGTDIPLGVPGEWTWDRRDRTAELALNLTIAAVIGAIGIAAAAWVRRRLASPGRLACFAIPGLFLGTLLWWSLLLTLTPGLGGMPRMPWVLYFPGSSGYFTQAVTEVHDVRDFLGGYQKRVTEAEGMDRYLHLGTHPPGLTLSLFGLNQLCESSPGLVSLVEATEPQSIRESIAAIRTTSQPGKQMTRPQAASLWLATLLVISGAALGGPAIYGLARRFASPTAAWSAAALWPLVPSVIIFLPKSDSLFAGVAPALAWVWFRAVDRTSAWRAILFGLLLYFCLNLSLAFLPIALLIAIQSLVELLRGGPLRDDAPSTPAPPIRSQLLALSRQVGWALAGFLIPAIGLWLWADFNTPGVWLQNLRNHAEFYEHSPRNFARWLAVNPLELTLSLGAPVVLAAIWSLKRPRQIPLSAAVAWLIVFGILWLSGKNMGEAARLWCFHLAWPVLIVAGLWREGADDEPPGTPIDWTVTMAAQLLCCVLTAGIVSGFSFGTVPTP
jgi:hypothetical protein